MWFKNLMFLMWFKKLMLLIWFKNLGVFIVIPALIKNLSQLVL